MSYFETRQKCILAIGAHPDDVFLGATGYLLQLKEKGYRIAVLTLTSGSLAGSGTEREAEEMEASRLCGFDLLLGHLPDGDIKRSAAIDVIARAVDALLPDVILTHSGDDDHHDHVHAYSAAVAAGRFVPNIVTYEGPTTRAFAPTMTVDCTSVWEQKLAALRCHRSQMNRRPYLEWARIIAQYRSWPCNVGAFCEAFRVERQDCHSFPSLSGSDPVVLPEVAQVHIQSHIYA